MQAGRGRGCTLLPWGWGGTRHRLNHLVMRLHRWSGGKDKGERNEGKVEKRGK